MPTQQMYVAGFDASSRPQVIQLTVKVGDKQHEVLKPVPADALALLGYKTTFPVAESPLKMTAADAIAHQVTLLHAEESKLVEQRNAIHHKFMALTGLRVA